MRRLLIANRGEIVCRVARTAASLGIDTVGVYSETDRDSLHVDAVDVAVALGGRTPAESYLRGDALIAAALDTGCDAVHPGYGFLAERADFAEAVVDAGLIWVGPTADQIRLLGDKVAAKRAALAAGVPTSGIVEVADGIVPDGVTMPALVKAAAGGGGRGMRIVRSSDDLAAAITSASREAEAAFGDGTVFVEPYLDSGRHVEVQILGDAHGNVVHFHERDCSVQRRNQKVIEEAPAPGLDPLVRDMLHSGALALARHVGYVNAGTVEFLVSSTGEINFLEVNTRLQVEHPVTEAVTGHDLVELQLRVAAGERLPVDQADITVSGHAIEVRLVAEDPASGWTPSVGTVSQFSVDAHRVDTGVRVGSDISSDYDSLIAKVIEHAPDRTTACRRLGAAVRRSRVTGVTTNAAALVEILADPDFLAGGVTTSYLDEHPDVAVCQGPVGDDLLAHLVAVTIADEQDNRHRDHVTGFAPSGWRNLATVGQRRVYESAAGRHQVEYRVDGSRRRLLVGPWPEPGVDGVVGPDERHPVDVDLIRVDVSGDAVSGVVFEIGARRHTVAVVAGSGCVHSHSAAGTVTFTRPARFADHDDVTTGAGPVSPLPGTVIAVHVTAGDRVSDGQVLMVVEAMKMEHRIVSAGPATVTTVHVDVGDRVDSGDVLVSLDHER